MDDDARPLAPRVIEPPPTDALASSTVSSVPPEPVSATRPAAWTEDGPPGRPLRDPASDRSGVATSGQIPRSVPNRDDNVESSPRAPSPETEPSPPPTAAGPTGRTTDMLGDPQNYLAGIKVVGVGGGGANAVNRMIAAGLKGAKIIAFNTDPHALLSSDAD